MRSFKLRSWMVDGHDVRAIDDAIETALESETPCCIVLDTVKGKGCCFAETMAANHHIPITREQMEEGIAAIQKELERAVNAL